MTLRTALVALVLIAGAPPLAAQGGPRTVAPHATAQGPFELLLAHRAELALTDGQLQRVLEIRDVVEARNAPLIARLVAMRRELAPRVAPRAMSRHERAELRVSLQAARPLVEQIRSNNRAGMRAVGHVLTAGQKEALRGLVQQRRGRGLAPRPGPRGARGPGD